MENVWKRRLMNFWRGWVRPLLLVGIVLGSFRSAVADWNDVPTGSMKPTLLEGDRIVVNKLAYGLRVPFSGWWVSRWGEPQRGDVVICFAPDTGDRLVKRVVGLPGDVVELRDQQLLVNGQAMVYETLDRDFIEQIEADQRHRHRFAAERLGDRLHPVMATPAIPAARSFGPITVPPDTTKPFPRNRSFTAPASASRVVKRVMAPMAPISAMLVARSKPATLSESCVAGM